MNKNGKKRIKFLSVLSIVACVVFVVLSVLLIYFNVTHEYHQVKGLSMTPTLNNYSAQEKTHDSVFVSKVKKYKRGDIVVIDKDNDGKNLIIKRLIATSGDKLTVRKIDEFYRIVIIYNGENKETILQESYLTSYADNDGLYVDFSNLLSSGNVDVDLDNFITIPEGHIFYLGDNRLGSNDSCEDGTRPETNVLGKVDYIIYGSKNIYGQVIKSILGW